MADVHFTNRETNEIGLNIMGDHAYLLIQAIISDDPARISRARDFASRFDALLGRAAQDISQQDRMQINRDIIAIAQEFRRFILELLTVVLTKGFEVFFKPAVLNHMVSYTEYQIHLTNLFLVGREPVFEPIERELFWLPFFATQCRYIADNVGYYERARRVRAVEFAEHLEEKYIFTLELDGLARIGRTDFPVAKAHHMEVDAILRSYAEFLVDVIMAKNKNQVPGTLSTLYLDSGYRQLCLFATELARFNGTIKPACNPYARRYTIL